MANSAPPEMQTFNGRIASFQQTHHLGKRRASSQSKKKQQTLEWPHESPAPLELARAGFFYKPSQDNPDNVQCFMCTVKLDGWEPSDSPMAEHLAHSQTCAWALSQSVARQDGDEEEIRDPYSDEMLGARRGTFETDSGWVHEGKRGWRCKVARMVEAGWCFDPSPDTEDGATCFYCNLSLDGWEPKDDPLEEHKRRSPDCQFFVLLKRYGSAPPKKGKAKGKGRGSTASRLSVQSVVSVAPSGAPSGIDNADEPAGLDDSIMTTGTVSSQVGGKGKKKTGGPKAAAKSRKGKKASVVPQEEEALVQYPDLSQQEPSQKEIEEEIGEEIIVAPSPPQEQNPKHGGHMPTRQSKQAQTDSSMLESSQLEPAPKKRGRKAKAKTEPLPEPGANEQLRSSMVQLQEELDHSMDLPEAESTPQALTTKPKRGVKRSSDGLQKVEPDSSLTIIEDPPKVNAAPAKVKRGRKPKATQPSAEESEIEAPSHVGPNSSSMSTDLEASKPTKAKKVPARKASKSRKASSTRSSRVSKASKMEDSGMYPAEEDLSADERAIEAELARIAAEEAAQQKHQHQQAERELTVHESASPPPIQAEQDHTAEYSPSPTGPTSSRRSAGAAHKIHALERGLHNQTEALTDPGANLETYVHAVAAPSPRDGSVVVYEDPTAEHESVAAATPSPARSDKENEPATALKQPQPSQNDPRFLSPTKTSRIPLAPGTPNTAFRSPSKQILHLASTVPWTEIDIDAALMHCSPAKQVLEAGEGLSCEEGRMTLEEWVRWRAGVEEEGLRRQCEALVEGFEREGVRGLAVLGGVAAL